MSIEELQSKTITFLRFPMMVCVVLVHAHITEVIVNGVNLTEAGNLKVYQVLSNLISEVFVSISVPLFFFISGFLFFKKFSLSVYFSKLKKRIRTISFHISFGIFWLLLSSL